MVIPLFDIYVSRLNQRLTLLPRRGIECGRLDRLRSTAPGTRSRALSVDSSAAGCSRDIQCGPAHRNAPAPDTLRGDWLFGDREDADRCRFASGEAATRKGEA